MRFSVFLASTWTLLGLGSALPHPTLAQNARRACQTISPTRLTVLGSQPNLATSLFIPSAASWTAPTNSDNLMVMQNTINTTNPMSVISLVEFTVPSGSFGCQLAITDDLWDSVTYSRNGIVDMAPEPTMKFTSLKANSLTADPTYDEVTDSSIVAAATFGSLTVKNAQTKTLVNSSACPPAAVGSTNGTLPFVLSYSEEPTGYSTWVMHQQNMTATGFNGLYMMYNC